MEAKWLPISVTPGLCLCRFTADFEPPREVHFLFVFELNLPALTPGFVLHESQTVTLISAVIMFAFGDRKDGICSSYVQWKPAQEQVLLDLLKSTEVLSCPTTQKAFETVTSG